MPAAFCSKLSRSVGGTSSTPSSPVGLRGTGISPNITSANHAVSTAKTMTAYIPVVANEQGPEKVRMGVFWGGGVLRKEFAFCILLPQPLWRTIQVRSSLHGTAAQEPPLVSAAILQVPCLNSAGRRVGWSGLRGCGIKDPPPSAAQIWGGTRHAILWNCSGRVAPTYNHPWPLS